jgi:tetratricopeptide (TPR) repeat protein
MSRPVFLKAHLALILLCAPGVAQTSVKKDALSQDFSKESVVIQQWTTKVVFKSDGTYTSEFRAKVRIQTDAGVRQYGVLRFPYQASFGRVDVQDVRVTKPNGSVVTTPLDSIQDMTSDVSRDAPMYSDLREEHVPVKGLEPGDTLEYSSLSRLDKPLAMGQFWYGYQFIKSTIALDEQLVLSVPHEREVKLKSQTIQPTMREENGPRVYTWKTSNLESVSVEEQKKVQSHDAIHGLLRPPDVLISSFRSWEEVGLWYARLQQEKIHPSPEVKAKAEELTKGLLNDDAKLRAIYNYVSLRYRYVSISFGIGRYQPHAAAEILGNQYGDCKDKHTLLAALLNAVGIRAYPALINRGMAVDNDVPSPGQFNHVISVVAKGSSLSWMDTTPEVTPMGYLVYPLRGKPALVIMPDKAAFQTTPANSLLIEKQTSTVNAKLDTDGALEAHVESVDQGDTELYFRYAFRRWPESQWKDLIQQISYGARLGGSISNVRISPPEKTDEPFTMAYDYTLKDFSEGDTHRFVVPLTPWGPEVKDEDLNRKIPLWLGYVGEYQYKSRIELPKGWSATTPVPIDFKESFAEFQGSSEVHEGVLITKRRLLLKANEVTPDQQKSYKTFQKAISDDHNTYIFLRTPADAATIGPAATPAQGPARLAQLIGQVATLPGSSNSHAIQAEQDARKSMQTKDYTSAITALKYAVSIDATFSRAWIELGLTYAASKDKSSTLDALQKAVEADPKQVLPYKMLAFNYMFLGKQDNAIATWQKLQSIAPDDPDLSLYLGALYMEQKHYLDAVPLFESAVKANPSNAYAHVMLGTVRLRSHNTDQALDAFHKALEIDSSALMLNNVAYEMAEAGTNIPEALGYSQRSVKEVEERSQKVNLKDMHKADLQLPLAIASYWDTLGWIYFKMGDLARAESYVNSAWQLGQDGLMGDHLGQVYEKEQKLPAALRMYNLALEVNPRLEETASRMRNLAHVRLPNKRMSAAEELTLMRTIKLPMTIKGTASADFDVIVASGSIDTANFSGGHEMLRHVGESLLDKASLEEPFPSNSTARLIRSGKLSCSDNGCSFVFYPLSGPLGAAVQQSPN